jgi:hypothetical protein
MTAPRNLLKQSSLQRSLKAALNLLICYTFSAINRFKAFPFDSALPSGKDRMEKSTYRFNNKA